MAKLYAPCLKIIERKRSLTHFAPGLARSGNGQADLELLHRTGIEMQFPMG